MARWLWRVARTVPLALVEGVLWLVAGLALLPTVLAGLVGLAFGAAWLWLRTPKVLAFAAEGFGGAAAGALVMGVAGGAAEALRQWRYRIDPEAERRAYVRWYYSLPRVAVVRRPW